MRGLALAITLSIPLWALIIVGAVRVSDAARRGALPVMPHHVGEPVGGEP